MLTGLKFLRYSFVAEALHVQRAVEMITCVNVASWVLARDHEKLRPQARMPHGLVVPERAWASPPLTPDLVAARDGHSGR